MITGRIHSFQSLGTVDGPGVRAVVFMQGCPLRCACCHNPDTWDYSGGTQITVRQLFDKIMRCKNYFGENGGVTISGGEPLMQPEFLIELFTMLKDAGIHTALDTSGCCMSPAVQRLLNLCDLVILDYKYTEPKDYKRFTGCEQKAVDKFLRYLDRKQIETWVRQVIIPGLNDNEDSVKKLGALRQEYSNISKIELLGFKKLCLEKYQAMQLPFPLEKTPEPSSQRVAELQKISEQ